MAGKDKNQDGGSLGEAPNEKWQKFFEQFSEIETLDNTKWKPVHLIGYFCSKYYQAYNVKYSFKFNSPSPAKSFEVFQIKKLAMQLSSNPVILRDYIDWAYKEKVEPGKRRLTSISFITNEDLVNNYKINVLLSNKKHLHIDRSTPLPADYKENLKIIGPINTYGDLSFMYQSFKSAAFDIETALKFSDAMDKLETLGLDIEILTRII